MPQVNRVCVAVRPDAFSPGKALQVARALAIGPNHPCREPEISVIHQRDVVTQCLLTQTLGWHPLWWISSDLRPCRVRRAKATAVLIAPIAAQHGCHAIASIPVDWDLPSKHSFLESRVTTEGFVEKFGCIRECSIIANLNVT